MAELVDRYRKLVNAASTLQSTCARIASANKNNPKVFQAAKKCATLANAIEHSASNGYRDLGQLANDVFKLESRLNKVETAASKLDSMISDMHAPPRR